MPESEEQGLQDLLCQIESVAHSLKNQHQGLSTKVRTQSQQATKTIRNDRKALDMQLQRTGRSVAKTIEASHTKSSYQPLLSWPGFIPSTTDGVIKKDTLVAACTNLTSNFEKLTSLADQANQRLNAIHRAAMETEDEITTLTQDLEGLQSAIEFLDDLQGDLEDARTNLQGLEKKQAIAQQEMTESRRQEQACDMERRHQKKKARWLWAAAPVTGGLSAFPAMYASHSKRKSARLRDGYEDRAISLASEIEDAKSLESELSLFVQESEIATRKVDQINSSTAGVISKNQTIANMITAKCEEYICLKEEAMIMAARTRKLQSHVEMLDHIDGQDEVRGIMENLMEDLEDTKMKGRLMGT
ncbi:MAG: hypothetical protein Q9219_006602 [cf. Caloplaca sp. 3 TL-2023]